MQLKQKRGSGRVGCADYPAWCATSQRGPIATLPKHGRAEAASKCDPNHVEAAGHPASQSSLCLGAGKEEDRLRMTWQATR